MARCEIFLLVEKQSFMMGFSQIIKRHVDKNVLVGMFSHLHLNIKKNDSCRSVLCPTDISAVGYPVLLK